MIVFEDDNIVAIFYTGTSDYLVISFGDLINLANGEDFYARKPLMSASISCLGFMAKWPNWFPSESMKNAELAARSHMSRYQTRITYGCSMGGYAAIKFSALFYATSVIAYCPQWSIDRRDCGDFDPGWTPYYKPAMRGMAIHTNDIGATVFLFCDLGGKIDRFHQSMIYRQAPLKVTTYNLPNCGHDIALVMAGSETLYALLTLVRSQDRQKILTLVARCRRKSRVRERNAIRQGVAKLPTITSRYLLSASSRLTQEDVSRESWLLLLSKLQTNKKLDQISELLNTFGNRITANLRRFDLPIVLDEKTESKIFLSTHANTVVAFDLLKGHLVHINPQALSDLQNLCFPIMLHFSSGVVTFNLSFSGHEVALGLDPADSLVKIADNQASLKLFEFEISNEGLITISNDGRFLCADVNWRLVCDRPSCSGWEAFSLSHQGLLHYGPDS